jgi:mono/diheme cytochrome c family protein
MPMTRRLPLCLTASLILAVPARGEGARPASAPVSFLKEIAPILARRCTLCHNARRAEGRYDLTTFASLAKGGERGEGITLEPGDPDASFLVELIRPGGQPRMPYKLDPLPPEAIARIERWVREGASYDGRSPEEDWVLILRSNRRS